MFVYTLCVHTCLKNARRNTFHNEIILLFFFVKLDCATNVYYAILYLLDAAVGDPFLEFLYANKYCYAKNN